jgi:hypothetical protein
MDSDQEIQPPKQHCVFDVPDLANLIADYCDEEALSKMSRVSFTTPYA